MNAIYDPAVAAAGVKEVFEKLTLFKTKLESNLAAPDQLNAAAFTSLAEEYEAFPVTYDIDWKVAGIDRDAALALANEVRSLLQQTGGQVGSNKFVPRLFNQQ